MACFASKVVNWALGEVGYKETPDNVTKYAEYIDTNYPNFYNGKKNGYDWCDVFVDCGFLQCYGYDDALRLLCQPEHSTGAGVGFSADFYKSKGQFHDSPKVGDQIFFYNPATGSRTHTGLVVGVDSGHVYTVEGNTSNAVKKQTYSLGASNIYGYGRPAYDEEAESDIETYTVKAGDTLNDIAKKYGTTADYLAEYNDIADKNKIYVGQVILIPAFPEDPEEADNTDKVLALQTALNVSGSGEWDEETENAVARNEIQQGDKGIDVRLLQWLLEANGYTLPGYGDDGIAGTETIKAVKTFQADAGLKSDGIVGVNTWKALCGVEG